MVTRRTPSFVIPCLHTLDPAQSKRLPDHHPLTRSEIARLLDLARDGGPEVATTVQIRLCQGIPGYTCSRTMDDDVARRAHTLGDIFIRRWRSGGTPDLVEAIELAMRG